MGASEGVEALFPGYSRVAYPMLKTLIGGVMKGLYRIRVEGLENIPTDGPAILGANHISFLDSFFIPLVVPRRVTYLAKAEYWDSWKTRWFFDIAGQIPVRRQDAAKAESALDQGCKVLSHGGLLGIYPEGTRSPDGRLYRGKTGVARMALRADCPVVPVGLVGTDDIMPKEAKLPKARGEVTVRFAEPIRIEREEAERDPLAPRSFVDALMFEIMRLTGQEYVERYADRAKKAEAPVTVEQQVEPDAPEPVPTG